MLYHFGKIAPFLALLLAFGCGSGGTTSTGGGARSQTVGTDTNVVDAVTSMSAGDLYYIEFDDDGNASIDFTGAPPSTKYKLIVQATSTSSSNVGITKNLSEDTSFDSMLRMKEENLAASEIPAAPAFSLSKAFSGPEIGDSGSFKVLRSVTSTRLYDTIDAEIKCIEDHVIVYVDTDVPESDLGASDIATLCEQFEYSAAIEESAFGATSDVNEDGHVVVLITLGINRLGASGGGIVTGYFYASDLYASSDSNPTSNEMEIIYILAPDPDGSDGTAISKSFAMSNLMPSVVPHELQHAISYNQHVFVNGGSSERNWLNEALSHFAEDLVGFGDENPSRVEYFLDSPETTSLAPSSSPDLGERGAEYLFIRFMYERAANPDAFLAALLNTTETGQDNVVAAFAGTDAGFDEWVEFMRRWAIAVALTDTGISSTEQYQFNAQTTNGSTGNWTGVCLICDANDGRGTVLTGPNAPELTSTTLSLSGTATAFYTISSPPASGLINLTGSFFSALQGVLIRTE